MGEEVKALSVKQPWARLFFVEPFKPVENRGRRWSHRGPLVIHASQGWDKAGALYLREHMRVFVPPKKDHVFGALLGRVVMVDCVQSHPSRFFFGPWGYVFEDPKAFTEPVPWKGAQHPFEVPDEVVEKALKGEAS
jgi:hypothetical protein